MRALIAKEKGDSDLWDLKLVAGGLIDIEFIAQYLQLAARAPASRAARRFDPRGRSPPRARGTDDADAGRVLDRRAPLYTDATQFMRLDVAGLFDPAKAAAGVKRRIAAAAELPDFESLQGAVREAREAVRRVYARVWAATRVDAGCVRSLEITGKLVESRIRTSDPLFPNKAVSLEAPDLLGISILSSNYYRVLFRATCAPR